MTSVIEGRKNSTSLHYAPPDFLWNLLALVNIMRLSLTERLTRGPRPVQRGRKSGYAPVGMTILFGIGMRIGSICLGLGCRPLNRSVIPTGA
jgi:hypothetical protein